MDLLESALEYRIEFGFSLFPQRKDRVPLCGSWKPLQTTYPTIEQIKEWWTSYPKANIALITGELSNLLIIDCDTPETTAIIEEIIPDVLIVPKEKSPRGGAHFWFRYPQGSNLTTGYIQKDIEIKGEGGCCTVVPSFNDKGKYEWILKATPENIPEVPERLLQFILEGRKQWGRTNSISSNISLYKENENNVVNEKDNTTNYYKDYIILQDGTRGNDLFHIANCLVKGNCELGTVDQVINMLAKNSNPPYELNKLPAIIKSAFDRAKGRERNLADEVKEYFLLQKGYTFTTDILQTLQITTKEEKKNLTVILTRLVKDGIIEHYGEKRGCYKPIEQNIRKMNFIEGFVPEFSVKLPFGMNDILSIYPKNIIVLAGDKSAGKSAMLLNIAHMNQDLHPVHYLSSEMVEEEWSVRLKKWGVKKANEIRYQMEECSTDFHARIEGDHKIYIIDYLEIHDNFWEIGKIIRKIHDKLQEGICFIALQKKTNQQLGRGAEFSLEKARLYLTLDYVPEDRCSKLTIVDAKAPRLGESIRGYWKKIKIRDSIFLSTDDNTWRNKK